MISDDYEVWRCLDCGAESTSPRITSEGAECLECGSINLLSENELDGFSEYDPMDIPVDLFPDLDDVDFGDDDYAY